MRAIPSVVACLLAACAAARAENAPSSMGMGKELDEAFEQDHLDPTAVEMYGDLESYDSGARLDIDTCDDAMAGALHDIDEHLINWGTANILNTEAMCNYQRYSTNATVARRDFTARCARNPKPLMWERRACEHCANHICIEHKIEYFVNESDQFGHGDTPIEGGGVVDRTGLRVVRNDTYPYTNREYPLYAPGEPPVADRHRPLWGAWGEYAYIGPQRWLHNLEHGAVVVLYDPCLEKDEVDRLRRMIASLPESRDVALRRRMNTPELAKDGPKFIMSPSLNLGRAFAVLVWQAGLMSDCIASDIDFAGVQPTIEAFLTGHHGNTVEANLTYSGRYKIGILDEVAERINPLEASSAVGILIWTCGAVTGAAAVAAVVGFYKWKHRFLPYQEIVLTEDKQP